MTNLPNDTKTASDRPAARLRAALLLALATTMVHAAGAQQFSFTPGVASTYAGDTQNLKAPTPADITGIPVGNSQGNGFIPDSPTGIVYDANGNLYLLENGGASGGTGTIRVVASGNGPIASLPSVPSPAAGTVYTLAGNGKSAESSGCTAPQVSAAGNIGDGCPATQAEIGNADSLSIDRQGNLYFSDSYSNQQTSTAAAEIRVVYAAGTVPGLVNPRPGYIYAVANAAGAAPKAGIADGTPALSAPIGGVSAADPDGNIYVAVQLLFTDPVSGNVQSGTVIYGIYAGTGGAGFPAGAIAGQVYTIAGSATQTCGQNADATCGDGGPSQNALINYVPSSLLCDLSGNVYFFEQDNIGRQVNGQQKQQTPDLRAIYAGGTLAGVANPVAGDIYTVAGTRSGVFTTTLGQDGVQATSGNELQNPSSAAFDTLNQIYYSDLESNNGQSVPVVRKVDTAGIISTLVNGGNAYNGYGVTPCAGAINYPADPFLDGCAATNMAYRQDAFSQAPLAIAPNGDLLLVDIGSDFTTSSPYSLLRRILVAQSYVEYDGTIGLPYPDQTAIVSNTGSKTLQLSGIAFTGPYQQATTPAGATYSIYPDCSASSALAPGQSCDIAIHFNAQAGSPSGTVTVTSNATNPGASGIAGVDTIDIRSVTIKANSFGQLTTSPAVPSVANVGQPVTLTATLQAQAGSSLTPSGTVTFLLGAGANPTAIGTGTLNANGVATLITGSLPAGADTITASYPGDVNFNPTTTSPVTLTVSSKPVPVVTVTAPATAVAGSSVTITATVQPYSGSGTPTGTVTFQDGANVLGTGTLNAGTATLATTKLPLGPNTLFAVYGGDSNFGGNTSAGAPLAITAGGLLNIYPGTISLTGGTYSTFSNGVTSGPAAGVSLNQPHVAASDPAGNVYIAGSQGYGLGVIASGSGSIPGVPSPVKGNYYQLTALAPSQACSSTPTAQNCGDGGPALQASVSPYGIAADAFGNVYIEDSGSVVWKIDPSGTIHDIAGTYGVIYSAFPPGSSSLGDGGPALNAQFNFANNSIQKGGLAVDNAGDVYITDSGDNLIRRVDGISGIIDTVAGNASSIATTGNQCTVAPCGDGGPARAALLNNPAGIALDPSGNLYIADTSNYVVRKVDAQTGIITTVAGFETPNASLTGITIPTDTGLATTMQLNKPGGVAVDAAGDFYIADTSNSRVEIVYASTGKIEVLAGAAGTLSSCPEGSSACGDGGISTSSLLSFPLDATLDGQGNLYFADSGSSVIRAITTATSGVDFGSVTLGVEPPPIQNFILTDAGSVALTLSALTFSKPDFLQQPSGGADCTYPLTLNPGQQCQLTIGFFPLAGGADTGSASLADTSANATAGANTIQLAGTGASPGGGQAQTLTFPPLSATVNYGQTLNLGAVASSGLPVSYIATGPGRIDNTAGTLTAIGSGAITVTAYQFGNTQYAEATPIAHSTTAATITLTVSADNQSVIHGQPIPALTFSTSGLVNGDTTSGAPTLATTGTPNSPVGTYPITIAQGTLQAPAAYQLNLVPGTLYITGATTQTISFAPLANASYGAAPVPLSATASSGLPVSFTVVSGPGQVVTAAGGAALQINGAGSIVVAAKQYGNDTYAAAPPVTQTVTVGQHLLTVTAGNVTTTQGQPIPSLAGDYTIAAGGFVNGDTAASLTGAPAIGTTAIQGSPAGTYPINIAAGTLASTNYSFNFVPGTLTIVVGQVQTIAFPAIPAVTYGVQPIQLNAGSSSGLAVSYRVQSGPATVSGNLLSVTGAGMVTVIASQPGSSTFAPAADVPQSFISNPAVLTITANNATRPTDTVNPVFGYTPTGFVNGDTAAVLQSQPAFSTTALPGSPAGTYPITVAGDQTFAATNYTFVFVPGTLTITPGGPAADFSLAPGSPGTVVTVLPGQIAQATIVLTPVNFFQDNVTLSCGNLPANVTCIFTPAALSVDGTGTAAQTTLTVNTNPGSPVGLLRPFSPDPGTTSYVALLIPCGVLCLLGARRRLRGAANSICGIFAVSLLLLGSLGLLACGTSKSSGSGIAGRGSTNITVIAKGAASGVSHTLNLTLTVQ